LFTLTKLASKKDEKYSSLNFFAPQFGNMLMEPPHMILEARSLIMNPELKKTKATEIQKRALH
jgi:hypothetical protein